MTINEIIKNTKLKEEVAVSLYWHCLWLREVPADYKVNWALLCKSKEYRTTGKVTKEKVNEKK